MVSEYLLRIQTFIYLLSSIGDFVPATEYVDIILDGLPDKFESLVTLISCRFEPLTVDGRGYGDGRCGGRFSNIQCQISHKYGHEAS